MSPDDSSKDATTPNSNEINPPVPTTPEDDFGDEQLGERQAEACSLDEGCTVCQ